MERKKHSKAQHHAKGKASRGRPRRNTPEPSPWDVPPEFVGEQMNRLIQKILGDQDFATIEEANQFLQEQVNHMTYDQLLARSGHDPIEQAQELAYQALGADTPTEATKLARRALELDPDCTDAQAVLALATAESAEEAIEKTRDVIRRAEERFGPEFMREAEGEFWSILETRPYMRAREQVIGILLTTGREAEAIDEAETLLRLNPGDNQGIRYLLLGLELQGGRLEAANRLLAEYPDEGSAVFSWGRVLERLLAGDPGGAEAEFHEAMGANRYFYEYMTGQRKLPRNIPASSSPGDEGEGLYCIHLLGAAWLSHPEAMAWLVNPQGGREVA